jgi:hypothetical protein
MGGEVLDQRGIINGIDPVIDALDAEQLESIANVARRPFLAGMCDCAQTKFACGLKCAREFRGWIPALT